MKIAGCVLVVVEFMARFDMLNLALRTSGPVPVMLNTQMSEGTCIIDVSNPEPEINMSFLPKMLTVESK
jgi:hypothetical protein